MKELLEQIVNKVEVSEDEDALIFHVGHRDAVVYETEAECCSETWFADIIGLHNLLGREVVGVRVLEVELPEDDKRTRQDYDLAYGYRLTTAKGDCDFIFRNSSNGYYGGSLRLVEGDRVNQFVIKREFREITENDWTA